MKVNSKTDLTEGSILKKLLIFIMPLILTNLLQQFYTTADQIVVGKFAGETALAAVGSTGHLTNLLLNLFWGISSGSTVICAKFLGAKNSEKVQKTVHTSIIFSICAGLALGLFGILTARPMLVLMDTPENVIDHSVIYMSIIFAGVPFSMLFNFGVSILRAAGESKKPLYILTISGLINVILNVIFVVSFGMAEAGVALATIISQILSAVSVTYLLMKRDDDLKLVIRKLRFHKNVFISIIKVGVPTGINSVLYSIANITLQSTVNGFGSDYMAANTAASGIGHYINLFQAAAGTAVVSFVGQNYGAKKYDRIHRVSMLAMWLTFAMSSVIVIGVVLFPRQLLGLYINDPEVIEKGVGKLLVLGIGYLFNVPAAIFGPTLRGIERSKTPMFINVISVFATRIAWLWFVGIVAPESFTIIFFCYPISWFLSSVALWGVYLKCKKGFPKEECDIGLNTQ